MYIDRYIDNTDLLNGPTKYTMQFISVVLKLK